MASDDLSGLTIVVTRPRDQAATGARFLEALGAKVILFPVLQIEALPDHRALMDRIYRAA